jgi:hypothetical protein
MIHNVFPAGTKKMLEQFVAGVAGGLGLGSTSVQEYTEDTDRTVY